jgi:hypothetical protein
MKSTIFLGQLYVKWDVCRTICWDESNWDIFSECSVYDGG